MTSYTDKTKEPGFLVGTICTKPNSRKHSICGIFWRLHCSNSGKFYVQKGACLITCSNISFTNGRQVQALGNFSIPHGQIFGRGSRLRFSDSWGVPTHILFTISSHPSANYEKPLLCFLRQVKVSLFVARCFQRRMNTQEARKKF